MPYIPRNQLILSTTYNLSASSTKQVVVGAELDKNGNKKGKIYLSLCVFLE